MAALSCYQPCRSHLAQPARCLDEEDISSLTLRRRAFIERCQERGARAAEPPAVRRARDEPPRRLTVDSGWSKVEEVRKKFEGAAATASANYSRSFESPPRRRLADSLFASFKLPRKREGAMAARPAPAQPKRKSAVELLAESKAFYVKSETVRDRKQDIPLRVSSGLSQAIAAGGCHLVSSGTLNNDACCNPYATAARATGGARRAGSAGEGLQHTLRRLLEHADSRENVYSPPVYAVPHKLYSSPRRVTSPYGGRAGAGGAGAGAGVLPRPRSFGSARVFFPDSFRLPPQHVDMPSPHSSPDSINPELSAEQIGAISPPAQYAHSAPRYTRSNSHSQPSVRDEESGTNINSHKSLPDLHSQAQCYPEHVPASGTETIGRSPRRRRHSAHQRTASCSSNSKGTRSNHSSLLSSCEAFSEHPSPGDDNYVYNSRCGSSFARDSGGSSGHYTQRSAPPHAPHAAHAPHARRNDSGSSTQHERASRYNSYYAEPFGASPEECYVSAPPQFQDGAPSPPPAPPAAPSQRVGIHFQASAPPPQFQDEPVFDSYEIDACAYRSPLKCLAVPRNDFGAKRDYNRYREASTDVVNKQPLYAEPRRTRLDDTQDYVNAQLVHGVEEVTSPLGTFKRQRCLRYKQRRPRPILRSKSDISDRYRRTEGRSPASAPCEGSDSADSLSSESERLRHFFERLGLDARQFEALVTSPDAESPVFFSSCSSVDSTQLPDYTVQGPPQKQIYRNTEPPSVVERNARIVKWLCQCRKSLLQPQH